MCAAERASAAEAAPRKAHSPTACRKATVPANAMAAKAAAASAPAATASVGFKREKGKGEEQRGDASAHHHDRPHGISARIRTLCR
jgi:hypothetical protein